MQLRAKLALLAIGWGLFYQTEHDQRSSMIIQAEILKVQNLTLTELSKSSVFASISQPLPLQVPFPLFFLGIFSEAVMKSQKHQKTLDFEKKLNQR